MGEVTEPTAEMGRVSNPPALFEMRTAILPADKTLQIKLLCVVVLLAVLGIVVAWGVLLAGPLDAIENAAMLRVLAGDTGSPWPQLSTACAIVKFSLVFGGLGYIAVGAISVVRLWLKAA